MLLVWFLSSEQLVSVQQARLHRACLRACCALFRRWYLLPNQVRMHGMLGTRHVDLGVNDLPSMRRMAFSRAHGLEFLLVSVVEEGRCLISLRTVFLLLKYKFKVRCRRQKALRTRARVT